jgi:tetratricopeptide (TPR) repeat protein
VRENYEGYIKKAADFHKNKKDLQQALYYATSAFKTCKKSDEARSMVKQINRDIKKVEDMLDQVASDIQSASFINAKEKVKAISDIWVNALRLEEMKKECKTREEEYKEYYSKTIELYEEKDLEAAIKSADQALKIFSSSPQLLEVHKQISNDMATATKLFKSVSSFISFAKFNEAKANINLIINMWPKFPNIEETSNKVELTENSYKTFYDAAKTLLNNKRDLISARDNISSALTLCSQSQEAKELRQQIDNTIFEKEQRNQKIKGIAIGLIQVVGVLLIGGAIVYFIVWPIMAFVWGIISWILRNIIIPIFSGIIHIFSSIFYIFSK